MRIVYIAAGAAGMYCGACARDAALVTGLIARGHDVQVVPLYTPLRIDSGDKLPTTPIFYGGINVFLQQFSPIFRHMPAFIGHALDSPGLLKWVSKFAIRTQPRDLGPMTVSVLAGKDGLQRSELAKLMHYLESDARPEVGYAEKIEFMKSCGVFCVPSRIGESRGMAVMEAMAAGVPVVVPDTGVFPEMIELTGGGLLFPSGDATSLARSIRQIMDEPALGDSVGKSASEGITRYFSADEMAERVIEEYEGLIAR